MSDRITFMVPGEPVPKARPRLGRHNTVYTPRRTADAEEMVGWCAKAAGAEMLKGPVRLELEFILERPKGGGTIPRGDVDNYAKTVMDGLEGICYKNDSQVVTLVAHKRFTQDGEELHTRIIIKEGE